ncbi:hypothetical protein AYI70_g5589 [Smittium culicis]|uniref:Uncharacterized protein n=1 Tax=Smittium culicis TaxID=133412 RepID=A0A1R1XU28_9FUNG|nr:hypothetical protein AYI70_g5589 [Smittium culicis]
MEQVTETQAPANQDQVRVFTELVQQLLCERKSKQESEDPLVSKSVPITNFTVYPELSEAFLSIENDYTRYSTAEEKRKIKIHSYTKASSTNYKPPPLN